MQRNMFTILEKGALGRDAKQGHVFWTEPVVQLVFLFQEASSAVSAVFLGFILLLSSFPFYLFLIQPKNPTISA